MEWISVEDRLPESHDIIMVKTSSGNILKSYFHADKMAWAHFCYEFPWTYFQSYEAGNWLCDVTHWMPLPNPPVN